MTGAERICRALEALGVETVFGLPGSQNVALFEALRTSRLRTIVATHELAASFMANGYARASGRPGVLVTIPGPGFTYALTGLAEALLDSAPLLYILGGPAAGPGRRFQLQALDQRAVITPLVKRVFDVESAEQIEDTLRRAHALCLAGEPGPVVVQVRPPLFAMQGPEPPPWKPPAGPTEAPPLGEIERRLGRAGRPLLYVGQGALGAAQELRDLVERLRAPVVTTTSARGVLPEDHPWVLRFDRLSTEVLNDLAESADLILALGCKFSHNGAHGFRLRLPADRLIHVDASTDVLGANYETSMSLAADVPSLIRGLLERGAAPANASSTDWTEEEVASWNERGVKATRAGTEPKIPGLRPGSVEDFFAALRRAMPADSCLVLDSGLHQMLARRYFRVLRPRGLLLPTDLQSMGFALPAAIGARLARPERPVVALLGDGGFAISGLELLTAVRERVPLTVIVFDDGHYGLIRKQQLGAHGHAYGTRLRNPDFRGVAHAIGARHMRLQGNAEESLGRAIEDQGVTVIEVGLSDPRPQGLERVRNALVSRARRWLSD